MLLVHGGSRKLKRAGIKTHHLWSSDNVMFARKCRLLPIEVVVRGYMTGSTNTSIWPMYKSEIVICMAFNSVMDTLKMKS